MSPPSSTAEATITHDQSRGSETRLQADEEKNRQSIPLGRGYQRVIARVLWLAIATLALWLFIAALPLHAEHLHVLCENIMCGSSQTISHVTLQLHKIGLTIQFFTVYTIVIESAFALVYFVIATIIFWRKSADLMALLFATFLITFVLSFTDISQVLEQSNVWLRWLSAWTGFVGEMTLPLCFYLFPNGRFVPRWMYWLLPVWSLWGIFEYFFPGASFRSSDWFLILESLAFAAGLGSIVVSQVYRYRCISSPAQKQQTKWVVFGMVLALGAFFGAGFVGFVVPSILLPALSLSQPGSTIPVILSIFANSSAYLIMLIIPLSLAFAILRYRLWDIDIIIHRTLVYGTLSASVIGIYVLVVVSLGLLFQTQGNLVIALLATGLIAVLFHPLRNRLQRAVNRLMYGERDDPHRVISQLGSRLEATLASEAMLPTIVETVAQALKLPYAAMTLKQNGEFMMMASYGTLCNEVIRLPIVFHNEAVGELILAPRAPGESFTAADRALLEDLTRQVGMAAHAVCLTADLKRLTVDLQHSRTRLVTAREEERRRLRRDLHDGLGSALTSVAFQLDAACNLLDHDPKAVRMLLTEQKVQLQASIVDIRRLIYNLRPPILDEWGLVAALCEQVTQYQLNQVQVTVEASEHFPELPAAVEVAAYRIALEALANVIRHARASICTIRLDASDDELVVEVRDNGGGLPQDHHTGVGISAMCERAAELGGACVVKTTAGTPGTLVCARLPIPKE